MKEFSDRYKFSEWPNRVVPYIAAGVYAIWDGDSLIYCGMSGRQIEIRDLDTKKKFGLYTRLASHASGRLSGDQFCVYVANRIVIPDLTPDQLVKFSSGELSLDQLTKSYIHKRLEYQFIIVTSSSEAYRIEIECRRGDVFGVRPILNPA